EREPVADSTRRNSPRPGPLSGANRRRFDEQGFIGAPEYGQARVIPTPDRPGKPAIPIIPNGRRKTMKTKTAALPATDLQRRRLLLGAGLVTGFAALGVFAGPADAQSNLSAEDRATLQRAQTYLQNLTSAQGTFVETGPGGQRREG